jgi:selenocysteine-specific elongation factor
VNIQGVEKDQLSRGDTIVSAGFFKSVKTLDAKLELLNQAPRGLKTGSRIRFYNTTQEAVGRIAILGAKELGPGQEAFVQFRFEQPLIIQHGDRFILRFYSPMETLGGGMALNPHARRHKQSTMEESLKNLGVLEKGSMEDRIALVIAGKGLAGYEENALAGLIAADKQEISAALASLVQKRTVMRVDNLFVHTANLALLENKIIELITKYHRDNPLKAGLEKEELKGMLRMRLSPKVLALVVEGLVKKKQIEAENTRLRLPSFKAAKDQSAIKDKIADAVNKGGSQPPTREELPALFNITEKEAGDLLKLLARDNAIIRINDTLYLSGDTLESIKTDLKKYLEEKKEITMAEFRDLAKTSRKFAVPLMEYFDSQKLTQRVGDKRVLRE